MFVAKILAAIGLLVIAGGIGILLGVAEKKLMQLEIRENMEKEYEKSEKYKKNRSIFN